MSAYRLCIQPDPGPHNPLFETPPRPAGTARRTTSIDVHFPDFDSASISIDVRGRDVGDDGVRDEFVLPLTVDLVSGVIADSDIGSLVGVNLRSGFRRWLAEFMPEEALDRTLQYSVLDDMPGAFLVSGYALLRDGLIPRTDATATEARHRQADVCAGWDVKGPVYLNMYDNGMSPTPYGPVAPPLEAVHADSWHELAPLAIGTVRRRRCLDVSPGMVHGHFRDSYTATDHEMVMHEYEFTAALDGDRIAAVDVTPRVLPWDACPNAIASAQGVVGQLIDEVAEKVRADFKGTPTCTHLNSTMASLADVGALT